MACVVAGCFIGLVINYVFRKIAMRLQPLTPAGGAADEDDEKGHGGSE